MKKEDVLNEMLEEVKSLKNLTKREFPLIAKEYISAQKVQNFLELLFGTVLVITASAAGLYWNDPGDRYESLKCFLAIYGVLAGISGTLLSLASISELIDLYMQPKRMAIKAITTLKD